MNQQTAQPPVIKIPRLFYDNRADRAQRNPTEIRRTSKHVIIRRDDPALPDLIADAATHTDPSGPRSLTGIPCPIKNAARFLLLALRRQGVPVRRRGGAR